MSQWEQDIRLLSLDGAADLPATMVCPVCLVESSAYAFRPTFRQPKQGAPGRWLLRRNCAKCHARRAAGGLTLPETERWEALFDALDAEVLAEKARRLAERIAMGRAVTPAMLEARSRQGQRITEAGTSPYDIASAQLEHELGRPEEQWTRAENLECTRRIYRLLGWDEDGLKRGSPADQAAKAAKQQAEEQAGEQAGERAQATDNEEEEG